MTWSSIVTYGEPLKLSFTDVGCGCCSNNTSTTDVNEAKKLILEHLDDLRSKLQFYTMYLKEMEAANAITEIGTL